MEHAHNGPSHKATLGWAKVRERIVRVGHLFGNISARAGRARGWHLVRPLWSRIRRGRSRHPLGHVRALSRQLCSLTQVSQEPLRARQPARVLPRHGRACCTETVRHVKADICRPGRRAAHSVGSEPVRGTRRRAQTRCSYSPAPEATPRLRHHASNRLGVIHGRPGDVTRMPSCRVSAAARAFRRCSYSLTGIIAAASKATPSTTPLIPPSANARLAAAARGHARHMRGSHTARNSSVSSSHIRIPTRAAAQAR